MPRSRKAPPAASSAPRRPRADGPAIVAEGRRVVVLKSELSVEGIARPLCVGRVVEGRAERFATLHETHVRDASEQDVVVAGDHLVRLDLPDEGAEPASAPEPSPGA